MRKFNFRIVLCACLAFCMILSAALPVFAAPGEAQPLATIAQGDDLTFVVAYDKEFPDVTLVDPDGGTIEVKPNSTAVKLATYDTWAMVQVVNPKAGEWSIAIDKKTNTEVTWNRIESLENIWIQYIKVTPNADGTVQVRFLAERGTKKGSYDYELRLTTADSSASTLVKTGSATAGEEKSVKLDLKNYTSYDKYVFQLTATMKVDGNELYDEYKSDPFSFQNPNTPDAPEGIDIAVDLIDRQLLLDWENYRQNRFESYFLEVLAEGADEPIYYGEFQKKDVRFSLVIPRDSDDLTVNFYGRDEKLLSAPVSRKINLAEDRYIQILTESPTASNQIQIKMDLPDTVQMNVTVGENVTTYTSAGKENIVAVGIANGSNQVCAEAIVDGINYRVEKLIYKDGFPPMLSFYEPYDGKTFNSAKVNLVGNAESAKHLYLNDSELELDAYGDFSVEITLLPGENIAEFIAEDEVGNRTNRTIYLYGPENGSGLSILNGDAKQTFLRFLPLLISLVLAVAAIIMVLVMVKRRDKLKKFSYAAIVCILAAITVCMALGLVSGILHKNKLEDTANSMELSHLADESVTEAIELLDALEAAQSNITLWIWLTIGAAVLFLVAVIIEICRKRPPKPKAPPAGPVA